MPELPEVETIKNDLRAKIVRKKITALELTNKGSVRLTNDFEKKIVQAFFVEINRKGKLLIFKLSGGDYLLIHLKMTGQLIYQARQRGKDIYIAGGHGQEMEDLPNRHTRIILRFADNANLYFNDLRKFGYWQLVNEAELQKVLAKYGPEPLEKEFKKKYLQKIFQKTSRLIKAVLLDQSLIAGIGNIYADEILFAAAVRPDRRAASLSEGEIEEIWKNSRTVIKNAIKYRGTTFNNYRDAEGRKGNYVQKLKVYGRKNLQCLRCGHKIIKQKIAGRGTSYCEWCQK
ncbi:bifunctional DNA-formamidopyrimidine glycosylase/DNA-(apurinic or apyrimidinic site) lyase [Candidatus Parcubacteria bacterium]|nr:bifunctional DNA-formamidopyrimidine glycosylase/DNA-(apurinic or apyrimidinic site) lyase [Patescibacteria group bacterium]MBU4309540.1 bifunctional DNA-formamidopyrimidine glycosylase/DNA-(apurinic or apyrimidinic site) lyase [Patescibacteria group bacterium]MBU4432530.1 bifunctional DNA-formamidopyrimidine glycosylase/DNA-(apurinic or apyrimidinic site) lyase [Patescibacteria group bacterium]MBU4578072.1 bifunctional DNA-formamidopyrimidine glycosylase/DNA-(apurinic or apyrimidinic site) l